MDHTYWQKQTDKPLFPELEWDKPERRDQAGSLLIIGGYLHNLNAPAKAYEYAIKQGIGNIKVALPSKTKALLGNTLPAAVYLPSTKSGELAHDGLNELLGYASWADTLLIAGDVGRNSQTTLLLADLVENSDKQLIITKDALEALQNTPELLVKRNDTTLIASFAQLQKIVQNLKLPTPITFTMDLVKLVNFMHKFTSDNPCAVVTFHQNNFIVAYGGLVSTTKHIPSEEDLQWRTKYAAISACYQAWNPSKPFEALTHAIFDL